VRNKQNTWALSVLCFKLRDRYGRRYIWDLRSSWVLRSVFTDVLGQLNGPELKGKNFFNLEDGRYRDVVSKRR
jgi:hypothetical protein